MLHALKYAPRWQACPSSHRPRPLLEFSVPQKRKSIYKANECDIVSTVPKPPSKLKQSPLPPSLIPPDDTRFFDCVKRALGNRETCTLHPSIQVSHTNHPTGSHRDLHKTRQDVQRSWSSEDSGFIKTTMKKPSIAPKNATSTNSTLKQPRAPSPSSCSLVKGQCSLLHCKLPSTKSAQEGIIYYPSRHVSCDRPLIGTDADY